MQRCLPSVLSSLCLFSAACDDGTPVGDAGVLDAATDAGSDSTSAARWTQLGQQVSPAAGESEDPAMLVTSGGPAVGYRQASFGAHLHFWDGTAWGTSAADPAGGKLSSSSYRAPDFCVEQGAVLIAYALAGESGVGDPAFYDRIFVQRYSSATGWQPENGAAEYSQVYNATEGGYDASEAAIGCKASGSGAVVAWLETDTAVDLDRDAWVRPVSGGGASGRVNRVDIRTTDARVADVAVAEGGAVYLAHFEHDQDAVFSSQLFVGKWDGGNWTTLGGAIDTDADSNNLTAPSLALAGDEVYVAWSADHDTSANRQVYVAHWDGSAWETLGGAPVSAVGAQHFDSSDPDVIVVDGVPHLAWAESALDEGAYVFVARWVGGAWQVIGDRLNVDPERTAGDPSLAASSDGQTLYLAFEEQVEGWSQIFVKRYR